MLLYYLWSQKLHAFFTSALNGNEWSASHSGSLYFRVSKTNSRDSSVSIVTRLQAGRPGFDIRQGAGNFSLRHRVQTASGAHTASYPMDTGFSFPAIKWRGRKSDHSPPSNAEVMNEWSYTSTPS